MLEVGALGRSLIVVGGREAMINEGSISAGLAESNR